MVLRRKEQNGTGMAFGSGYTRGAISLTQRSIDALRPLETAYRVTDQRCIGLAVRVAPSGIKTWDLAYRISGAGKTRRLSLGRVCDVNLEKARERANELTSAARTGRDLIADEEEKRAAAAARLSIEALIDLYVKRRVTGRLRTAKEIESRLRRALLPIMRRFAGDIRGRDLRELFDHCADEGLQREAERRRQTVGAMFRWALSQDIIEIDPTAGLKAYDPGTPRDRVLGAEEIKVLWDWLNTDAVPQNAADILKLELLTGARCGEISGLCIEEVNRNEWTWTLPAARSKNKRPRVTPLVGAARQIVETRLGHITSGPLFVAGTGSILTAAHVGHYLLARTLPTSKFTTHDLRRTVVTQLIEMGTQPELVAAVIGHEAGTRETRTLIRHYVRTDLLDRKKLVLEAWDRRLSEIVEGKGPSGNVTYLASNSAA
jgi:integrase